MNKLKQISRLVRLVLTVALALVFAFLCIVQLMRIQIVEGEKYAGQSKKSYTAEQSIQAARGQIFDSAGRVLNTNKVVFKVIVQRAFFPRGEENEIISKTIDVFLENGEKWIDNVPISMRAPFRFTATDDAVLDQFKVNIAVNVDATEENCLQALYEEFAIPDSYDEQKRRYIAGVRYEMKKRDFSQNNRYTMAEDIAKDTVIQLKEQGKTLAGIDIVSEPVRIYLDGDTAPHIRGTIGAISAEQYQELKTQGYSMNDIIGLSGVEDAMESVLRGENGKRVIKRDANGVAISDEVVTSVKTGNSVKLTIDSEFQNTLQTILENHVNWLHNIESTEPTERWQRGMNTEAGSVVVLNAKTGAVLGMVNYPSYDINDYVNHYAQVLNAEGNPLVNRATTGLYRPGSTFKTITGTAGLLHNVITPSEHILCTGVYTHFDDYQPRCTGVDGNINVITALQKSCNIFFYETGLRLGIDNLAEVAARFGIGTDLGLETGGTKGRMTTPETFMQSTGEEFYGGDTLQAAIGQSETLVTPLHLAVQGLTLANKGVRYKPYLVDSVWDYEGETLIHQTTPEIAEDFSEGNEAVFDVIHRGMVEVSKNVVWPPHNPALWHYDYLPNGYQVAIKTGTPEVRKGVDNSTVMGFYPVHDPQIAFGIVLENSEWSRYMIRNIIDAYFYDAYEPDMSEDGIVLTPWKRWTQEKANQYLSE